MSSLDQWLEFPLLAGSIKPCFFRSKKGRLTDLKENDLLLQKSLALVARFSLNMVRPNPPYHSS